MPPMALQVPGTWRRSVGCLADETLASRRAEPITRAHARTHNASWSTGPQDELGNTPLHHAVWNNKEEMVSFLLNRMAVKDVNTTNADGSTALHVGRAAIVSCLATRLYGTRSLPWREARVTLLSLSSSWRRAPSTQSRTSTGCVWPVESLFTCSHGAPYPAHRAGHCQDARRAAWRPPPPGGFWAGHTAQIRAYGACRARPASWR
jgi:hypothetical protein